MGDRINLTSEQNLSPPVATWIEWIRRSVDISGRSLTVEYVWHNESGAVPVQGRINQTWTCDGSDFTQIFNFEIRSQDVGMPIGRALQKLIWTKMKSQILSPGNDGDFA
jgi:hypothetical protein